MSDRQVVAISEARNSNEDPFIITSPAHSFRKECTVRQMGVFWVRPRTGMIETVGIGKSMSALNTVVFIVASHNISVLWFMYDSSKKMNFQVTLNGHRETELSNS